MRTDNLIFLHFVIIIDVGSHAEIITDVGSQAKQKLIRRRLYIENGQWLKESSACLLSFFLGRSCESPDLVAGLINS